MLKLYGYGEDALTLWAIRHRLDEILRKLKDTSDPSGCKVFYRPSFGRSGGDSSSQFGEFDFIILSEAHMYLCESKWGKNRKVPSDGTIELPKNQLRRHKVLKWYVKEWGAGEYSDWRQFLDRHCEGMVLLDRSKRPPQLIKKSLAPVNSRLASNLQAVLGIVKRHFKSSPKVVNVLLYLHDGASAEERPRRVSKGFKLVPVDYFQDTTGNFIVIDL